VTSHPDAGVCRPLLLVGICAVTFVVYLDASITPVALPEHAGVRVHPLRDRAATTEVAAERLIETSGAANLSGATWMVYFARALRANIGPRVDLHTLPPRSPG